MARFSPPLRYLALGALLCSCANAIDHTSSPGVAVAAAALHVAATGINRAITGDCWGSCSKGYVCDHKKGFCVVGECHPSCPPMESCELLSTGYRCSGSTGSGPTPTAPPASPPTPSPAQNASVLSVNWMSTWSDESIGGIKVGAHEKELTEHFGSPDGKTAFVTNAATGEDTSTWNWKSLGLVAVLLRRDLAGEATVSSLTIDGTSELKTGHGQVGLNSTFDEVLRAYEDVPPGPDDAPRTSENKDRILIGSEYGGLFFLFEHDRVVRIFQGAGAE